jgi:hypothetical protein
VSRLILPQVHPTFDFVKEKFSAVAMSEGNHPSGSEALRDDTEWSRGGGPHTPTEKHGFLKSGGNRLNLKEYSRKRLF